MKSIEKELQQMSNRGVNPGIGIEEPIYLGDSRALTVLERPTNKKKKSRDKNGDCSICECNDCKGCHYYG